MGLGFAMGAMFRLEPAPRRRLLIRLGVACLSAFILLRAANAYGDPQPWSIQADTLRTLFSFMTVRKYPPSLSYLLVTLGSGFLLLAAFESARGKLANVLRTFGRVPLFFYVLHIAFAHFAAGVIAVAMGFGTAVFAADPFSVPREWGFALPIVYLAWLLVLLALYPACRWFARVKRRRSDWWLSYL